MRYTNPDLSSLHTLYIPGLVSPNIVPSKDKIKRLQSITPNKTATINTNVPTNKNPANKLRPKIKLRTKARLLTNKVTKKLGYLSSY